MNLFEEEQFFLNLQHLGQNGNGFYTFTDESDQHFDTAARQINIEDMGSNYQVELSHFDNSTSTYNAQMIDNELTDEYECFLTYDSENKIFVLQRLIAQIDLNPSRTTGQQDDFDIFLSRGMDEILNSQEEEEEEGEEDREEEEDDEDGDDDDDSSSSSSSGSGSSGSSHDVFEEILPTNAPSTQYSPYNTIAPTPGYSPLSPRYQLSSETNRYTAEFNARSPALEDSDHSEIVGYEPGYRAPQNESSGSESGSEEEDDDLDSLVNDLNMNLTTGVASAPDSPRPDYVLENNTNKHSPVTAQPHNAGPMSLRALFNDREEEEEEDGESQSNSDSD